MQKRYFSFRRQLSLISPKNTKQPAETHLSQALPCGSGRNSPLWKRPAPAQGVESPQMPCWKKNPKLSFGANVSTFKKRHAILGATKNSEQRPPKKNNTNLQNTFKTNLSKISTQPNFRYQQKITFFFVSPTISLGTNSDLPKISHSEMGVVPHLDPSEDDPSCRSNRLRCPNTPGIKLGCFFATNPTQCSKKKEKSLHFFDHQFCTSSV